MKNQEGKSPIICAIEGGHTQCVEVLKQFDAVPALVNRQAQLNDLIMRLVNEPPDYKKSIFSNQKKTC